MPKRSSYLAAAFLLAALCWGETRPRPAGAQTSAGTDAVKSEIYFGLRAADGTVADAQAWERFVTETVVPRFPEGLTVVEASGRSSGRPADLNPTRILVVVHAASGDAESRLREIKAEYRRRFAGMSIFHTDQPVRINRGD